MAPSLYPRAFCLRVHARLEAIGGSQGGSSITKEVRVNDRIRAKQVRVIDAEGNQVGVLSVEQALDLARSQDLDLVEVAPQADPPVCRILNFGKYKFQMNKRTQAAKKKQRSAQVKEIKLRPKTDEHDYQFKVEHVRRFLAEGNKAKITIMFRGREMAHTELGRRILDRIIADMGDTCVLESPPKIEGRNMSMIMSAKSAQAAVKETPREPGKETPREPGKETPREASKPKEPDKEKP